MIEIVRKSDKVNLTIIFLYGVAILLSALTLSTIRMTVTIIYLVFSLLILLFMNKQMKHETILFRSPLYYYSFLIFATGAIYISGIFRSELFPGLFIFPILYVAVNFSRKGSTGVAIFAVSIIWLTLLQDRNLAKIHEVVIASVIILSIPYLIGYIVKEYVFHMKRLLKNIIVNDINSK